MRPLADPISRVGQRQSATGRVGLMLRRGKEIERGTLRHRHLWIPPCGGEEIVVQYDVRKSYARWRAFRRGERLFSLLPWQWTESIYDLTGEDLYRAGIRLLLADLDNTLIPYSRSEPDEALRCWLADLNANGVTLFLLSNSRKAVRAPHFAQALGIDYLCHAGKPKTGGYRAAMERCGVTPEHCAMVGDQIFTDTLGANRAGIRSILVKPISLSGNPGRYLRYWAELPMRALARKRQWKGAS